MIDSGGSGSDWATHARRSCCANGRAYLAEGGGIAYPPPRGNQVSILLAVFIGQERNTFRRPSSQHGQSGHQPAVITVPDQQADNTMNQRLDARWRSEVTEALCTVQQQFGVEPQSLPREALIAALTDAIWSQRAAYARVRQTLVAQPELADESM